MFTAGLHLGCNSLQPSTPQRYPWSMARGSQINDVDPFALFYMAWVFATVLLIPALISRMISRRRSDSDSDEGGGGGGGSPPPPPRPTPPRGGIPLDDAQPARVRLRDARTLAQRLPARERRPAKEPARRPTRTPSPF